MAARVLKPLTTSVCHIWGKLRRSDDKLGRLATPADTQRMRVTASHLLGVLRGHFSALSASFSSAIALLSSGSFFSTSSLA